MNLHLSMATFVEVARLESFSKAARRLNMSSTAISRHVADLEQMLGVTLLRRTTRRVSLTDMGAHYLLKASAILEEIKELNDEVSGAGRQPRGTLRVTFPPGTIVALVLPTVIEFMAAYPEIDVEIDITERVVDLVGEGFDLAIRVAPLADSSLIARRILTVRNKLFASPEYLRRRGMPATPADVAQHDCIHWRGTSNDNEWIFETDGTRVAVSINCRLQVNHPQTRREAALRGFGLAILPMGSVREDVKQGRLVPVLPDYDLRWDTFYIVRPQTPFEPAKVRAFADFLARSLEGDADVALKV